MKIIKNRFIPPKGFSAINMFGIIFTRKNELSERTIRHEAIHTAQIREMLFIFFYVWYGVEWLVRLIQYQNAKEAYKNISFEREAYANDNMINYLTERKQFSFINHLLWQV